MTKQNNVVYRITSQEFTKRNGTYKPLGKPSKAMYMENELWLWAISNPIKANDANNMWGWTEESNRSHFKVVEEKGELGAFYNVYTISGDEADLESGWAGVVRTTAEPIPADSKEIDTLLSYEE